MSTSRPPFDPSPLVETALAALDRDDPVAALVALSGVVDAGPAEETDARVRALRRHLEEHPDRGRRLGDALRRTLVDARVGPALTESGVDSTAGFLPELGARLVGRLLPETDDPEDLRAVLRRAFPGADAHQRVAEVPDAEWLGLLDALGIHDAPLARVDPELASAIRTLAHHVGSQGLQPAFTRRLPHLEAPDSPFLMLTDRVLAYLRSYSTDGPGGDPELLGEALGTLVRCRAEVRRLRATKGEFGTSLELTGLTFRLLQLLDRLELLLHLTDPLRHDGRESAVALFREILAAEKTRHHLLPLVRGRADLLAFQVVEHAARKGGKYITSGLRDYWAFFLASLGGGGIVALFSFLKMVIGSQGLPLGIEGLLYGLNYSTCFVLIYLTGAALATKQPALTANTIAQALGNRDDRHLEDLESLVVRVWRSQFISFVGNLAMALPVAFLVSEVFFRAAGETIAPPAKAESMLAALHPWASGTLFFAAIAGVFLFLSGLISGWVDNRLLYSRVADRVAHQPTLRRLLGPERVQRLADALDRKLGALVGNVFLGFALGSTGTLGEILGLPLDIRHIAFASAEFGTALEILHFDVALGVVLPVALGVALIGLVNFLVSFGLSLALALESRKITWRETRILAGHLARHFVRRPLDWFFPPRTGNGARPEPVERPEAAPRGPGTTGD